MVSEEPGAPEPQREIVSFDKETDPLPAAINLPASAGTLTYKLEVNQTPREQRSADIEEKRKSAEEKRLYRRIGLLSALLILLFCFWEIFFHHPDEEARQVAEKIMYSVVAFLLGNAFPKFLTEEEKD